MKFEIEIPDSVIEDAVIKAICERAVDIYGKSKYSSERREFNKQIKAVTKAIVETNQDRLLSDAVAYAGKKILRDSGDTIRRIVNLEDEEE